MMTGEKAVQIGVAALLGATCHEFDQRLGAVALGETYLDQRPPCVSRSDCVSVASAKCATLATMMTNQSAQGFCRRRRLTPADPGAPTKYHVRLGG